MEFDYEEYYEKSELEELTNEYLEKAKDLFNKSLKELVEQTKAAREYSIGVYNLQRELEQKQKILEQKQKALYHQLIKELGLDLKIGQIVYIVKVNEKRYKCPHCSGKGYINIEKDGIVYKANCPHCENGTMVERKYETANRYIEGISYHFYVNSKDEIREEFDYDCDYINLTHENRNYKRKEIYLTLKEAENVCKELNEIEQERIKQ